MSMSARWFFLALLAAGGCAQADGNGLLNGGIDGAFGPDLSGSDLAQGGGLDFATEPYDAASSAGIQVCDLHKVRVNEVQTQGSAGASDEFVELYNPCSVSVALSGAEVVYRSTSSMSDNYVLWLFTNETIAAHGYFVVASANFPGAANAKPFENGTGLSGTAGGIGYRDGAGALIDSVGWGPGVTDGFVEGTAVGAPSNMQSAARTHDGVDTNDNLADFSLLAPTPGAAN